MEEIFYEFNTNRQQHRPLEACISALQDAQTYAALGGDSAVAERLASLEKQVKEIQTKLADVVTKEEFDSLAKEAVDTYVQSAELLKDYVKKTDLPDLTDYATKAELEGYVKEEAIANFVTKSDLLGYSPIRVEGENGTIAYMANEKDGGIMKVLREDGTYSKVTLNDGTADADHTMLQLYIGNKEGTKRAKINGTIEGLFYSKELEVRPEHEIATKADLKDIGGITPADLNTRVEKKLEGTEPGDVAKIQNQTDGGVMQYVSADKSNSAVTVNDGSQNVGAEICSLDPDGKGSRIIANKTGAYYSVGNAIDVTPEKEIAVKGDLAGFVNREAIENKADKTDLEKYIPINNDKDGNKSYMANEKDGGIIKYIKPDESYAKVTLCNVDEEAVAQIVATNKDKTTFAKIDARKDGICYSKKAGNPNLEEDEIVVKKDLKVYTPAEMEGLNPGDTAVCHNTKDGGSIKYMTETHTAFVGVDNGGDELFAEFALAENKQGKEFKKGNRLLAKKDGIFYTKDANSTTTAPEDEIITKKDITNFITEDAIAEKADKDDLKKYTETKLVGDNGTALIFNETDGGGAKFEASDGIESFVGVNDGKSVPGLYAQIYADKNVGGKWQGAKIDVTNEGIYYTVGDKSFTERKVADNEIATKGDLKVYSAAELTGVKPEHLATCHNAQDGGSLKYETGDHTAFIGVNYDNDTQELLAEFALTEKKDGKTLKSGNRLLAKEDGIYYTKSNNINTTSDNEIVTKADIKELALKTQIEQLQQTITQLQNTVQQLQEKVNT